MVRDTVKFLKPCPFCGGRGIMICDEWLNDFNNFYNWAMNNGYKEGLSIDRVDVDGDYKPSNCRWADISTQNNNKRKTLSLRSKNTHTSKV